MPKSSRIVMTHETSPELSCLIKVTSTGRISFTYDVANNRWFHLSDTDHMLYAHIREDGLLRLQMFKRSVIETAFSKLHVALESRGKAHIPHWLSPIREEGYRFEGSGFGADADWTIESDLDGGPNIDAATPTFSPKNRSAAVQEAKEIIAAALGLSVSDIELTISIRS